jgi:hypothetical protein
MVMVARVRREGIVVAAEAKFSGSRLETGSAAEAAAAHQISKFKNETTFSLKSLWTWFRYLNLFSPCRQICRQKKIFAIVCNFKPCPLSFDHLGVKGFRFD